MKKLLKILTMVAAVLTTAVVFATCKQFRDDPEEFLRYWSSEVAPIDFSINVPVQTSTAGALCIPSATDVKLTIKLRNPRNFTLVMPTSSDNAGKVIYFPGFSTQPTYGGTNYTLVQSADDKLELTYKSSFLKKYEWSSKNIGPEITLMSTDGRKFSKKFNLNLRVNTPPPTPTAVLAQTTGTPAKNVLCLQVPNMDASVTGGKLHKDIAQIVINGTPYPLTVSGGNFVKPSDSHFIGYSDVTQLAGSPAVPSGSWILYYNTDKAINEPYKAYTITLIDEKGLVSQPLNTGTYSPNPPPETITVTQGTTLSGTGTNSNPIIIKGKTSAPEAQIKIENIAGTTVHCTVKDLSDSTSTSYNDNPVIAPLSLGGANEKIYKVEYYTSGTGYTTPASPKTKYYKVLKQHRVTFNANGGAFSGGSSSYSVFVPHNTAVTAPSAPTKEGHTFSGWYTDTAYGTQWDFSTHITSDKTLYAKWTVKTYKVEFMVDSGVGGSLKGTYGTATQTAGTALPDPPQPYFMVNYNSSVSFEAVPNYGWEVDRWSVVPASSSFSGGNPGSTSATLSNITRNMTVMVKFKQKTIVKSTDNEPWKLLKEIVKIADENATITINGTITATNTGAGPTANWGEIIITKNLTIQGTNKFSDILDANSAGLSENAHRIFTVENGKTLTLKNLTLKNGKPLVDISGGAILVRAGCTADLFDCIIESCKTGINGNGGAMSILGTANLTRCTVKKCEAEKNGGGLYVYGYGSKLILDNSIIGGSEAGDGNKAVNGIGGGIFIENSGLFTMNSGEISGNTGKKGGGVGIFGTNSSFEMTGGTIIGNSASYGEGGGVFVNGFFRIKGPVIVTLSTGDDANKAGKNDVYLLKFKVITLIGSLNGSSVVARITPKDYARTTQVLEGSSYVSSQYHKFKVTPKGTQQWYVDNNGKLKNY
ncbi:InlB B-repeat-containing protein [Treponema denticola]|uniref:Polymorphic outer membrane protein n=1 Tax=Treponema denticola SP33 TaxID=999437 RepID=M2B3R4_TREDN|nr:InlB B-repeat-containing protein [Treponema denticola]EMB24030.1 hypothetical protein HMPREF9733_01479 [Treponema denticola SP33]EPF37824.1 hypothetical protein HMPREF9732_00417 [Treponema denticola SP32]